MIPRTYACRNVAGGKVAIILKKPNKKAIIFFMNTSTTAPDLAPSQTPETAGQAPTAAPKSFWDWVGKNAQLLALVQAIVAFLGSMYFSNIAGYPPCVLCWYQRILMFPLVLTLIVGIVRKDRLVHLYVLPAAIIGWIISLYHNLLYYKWIPDTLAPCTTGVSCTTKFIEYFGFVTIPFLAFVAFSVIIALMLINRKHVKKNM